MAVVSKLQPLMDCLARRFNSWENKSLSYPGRVQLVISVINSTLNFWMQAFILPVGCIRRIEQMCSRFIWNGNIRKVTGIKVALKDICFPKDEGGLGLQNLQIWNKVMCLKLVWNLIASSGSLWVAWTKSFYCRGLSFWEVEEKQGDSWIWKQLLRLRTIARPFIETVLGDGLSTRFWFDNWCHLGPLINLFGANGPRHLAIARSALVADVVVQGGWDLRPARSPQALELHIALTLIQPPSSSHGPDRTYWRIPGDASTSRYFSTSRTWQFLRSRAPKQYWFKAVWYKYHLPRHAFIFWLAHLDRFPVRMRLRSWGMDVSTVCTLCDSSSEDRNHLFLHCPYSLQVWRLAMARLGHSSHIFLNWSSLITWLLSSSVNIRSILKKLVVQCTIYFLWRERNNRIHQVSSQAPPVLFQAIDRCVRDRILSQKDKKAFWFLLSDWFAYY